MPLRLRSKRRTVGVKQTLKALQRGEVELVFIAKDADGPVVKPIRELCKQAGIEVIDVDTMHDLGKACEIDVGAACAAVVKESKLVAKGGR